MEKLMAFRTRIVTGLVFCLVVAGSFVVSATPAFACSCIAPPPPQEALREATDVFAGEVLEITEVGSGMYIDVRIRVDESWKGVEDQEITVRTPDNSAACGFHFEVGEEYLVYTSEMEGEVQVSLCSRTALLSDAGEDLDALGEGTPISSPETGDASSDDGDTSDDDDDGPDMLILGGSVLGFLAILGMFTALRRRR